MKETKSFSGLRDCGDRLGDKTSDNVRTWEQGDLSTVQRSCDKEEISHRQGDLGGGGTLVLIEVLTVDVDLEVARI